MDDLYTIDTPENIEFAYDIAGIGSRFLAAIIDTLLIGVAEIIIILLVVLTMSSLDLDSGGSGGILVAAGTLLTFVILWGYYIAFEMLWNGQSPGKRLIGLRVVREGGRPITFIGSAIRNLIRIVDFLPAMYGLGVVVMFIDRRARRLGDLAGGTLVVKERRGITLESLSTPGAVLPPPLQTGAPLAQPTMPNIELVNERDYTLIQEFLRRRSELGSEARTRLGKQLAEGLRTRLGLQPIGDPERFLQDVAGNYQLLRRSQQLEG